MRTIFVSQKNDSGSGSGNFTQRNALTHMSNNIRLNKISRYSDSAFQQTNLDNAEPQSLNSLIEFSIDNSISDRIENDVLGQYGVDEMKKIFSELDRDKNGIISVNDWRKVFKIMDEPVTDAEIIEIIAMCNQDGDNSVSITEFMSSLIDNTGGNSQDPNVQKMLKELEMDEAMNNDKSENANNNHNYRQGITAQILLQNEEFKSRLYEAKFIFEMIMNEEDISASEIKNAYQKCSKYSAKIKQYNRVPVVKFCKYLDFAVNSSSYKRLEKQLDKQKTGFMPFRGPLLHFFILSEANKKEKVDFCFEVFDRDGNNSIEFPELIEMLVSINPMIVTQQDAQRILNKADFFMKQCDTDFNGYLDRNEFQEMVQKFPNLLFQSSKL